jgi:hypothetical protein
MNDFDWVILIMLAMALGLNGYLDKIVATRVLPEVRLVRALPMCPQREDVLNRAEFAVALVCFYQWFIGGAHVLILILLWERGSFWLMLLVGTFLGLNMWLAKRSYRHRTQINL